MNFKAFVRANAKGPIRDATLELYDKDRQQITGRLQSRPLNVETAQELEAWLRSRFPNPNTLQRKITSLNWLLRWKGVAYQAKRPPKLVNANPRTIEDSDYEDLLARIPDPMDRLAVRISHDTGWSPSDVAAIRVDAVDLKGPHPIVRKVRQKTDVLAQAILEDATAEELRAYLEAKPGLEYVFPGDRRRGRPHRNRTWVNKVLQRYHAGWSPRAFRSNLATRWPGDDIKGLMVQSGWKSSSTIYQHYRANVVERQVKSFETALGKAPKDEKTGEDLPGYR